MSEILPLEKPKLIRSCAEVFENSYKKPKLATVFEEKEFKEEKKVKERGKYDHDLNMVFMIIVSIRNNTKLFPWHKCDVRDVAWLFKEYLLTPIKGMTIKYNECEAMILCNNYARIKKVLANCEFLDKILDKDQLYMLANNLVHTSIHESLC